MSVPRRAGRDECAWLTSSADCTDLSTGGVFGLMEILHSTSPVSGFLRHEMVA